MFRLAYISWRRRFPDLCSRDACVAFLPENATQASQLQMPHGHRSIAILFVALLVGCTIHPAGENLERDQALRSGKPFERRIDVRDVAPLPENPTPDQLVEYALLNNADLEQKYWIWRAAIEQISQDGTQSTSFNIAAGTNITNGHASWGSSTITLGNDPMTDIKWPGKLDAAARQSLENAKAAGRRFVKAKYELRAKVLSAYEDYALTAELIRLEQANLQLLETITATTASRNRTGSASEQDVLKTENEADLSRNDIAAMQSQLAGQQAVINALLGRAPEASLPTPNDLSAARPLKYSDKQLVQLAAKYSPELIALTDETRGREQAVRLARLQYVPDFNFSAGTDLMGITQSILGQATIPIFRYQALNAAIAQADANLRASEATQHQAGEDLAAEVVSEITTIRDADRQLDLFEQAVLPRARQIIDFGKIAYESGQMSLTDELNNQRSLIAIRRLVATLRTTREKHMATLEAITAGTPV